MDNDSTLLPCPFCGGSADAYCNKGKYGTFGYIACERCGAETRKKKLIGNSNEKGFWNQISFVELTAIWNQRQKVT